MKKQQMIRLAISIGTLQVGGAEVFVLNLLRKLDYSSYQVLLIVLSKRYNTFIEKEMEKLPLRIIYLKKKEGFRPLTFWKILYHLRRFKPHILHGNIGGLIYFLPYLFFTRLKMIHTVHTLADFEFTGFKRRLIKYYYQKDRIIPVAISSEVQTSIQQIYGLPLSKIRLINNGINTSLYQKEKNFSSQKIILGHIGRFEEVKNHRTIVEVYKDLKSGFPTLGLKLIGNGSLFTEFYQELKNDPEVEMIRETEDIVYHLNSIDIFIFPSIYEGRPLALMEAMAAGCVIVASSVGGIKDLILDGINGFLIKDSKSISDFRNTISKLIKDQKKMKEISYKNRIKAKDFDLTIMVSKYQDLYQMEAKDVNRRI